MNEWGFKVECAKYFAEKHNEIFDKYWVWFQYKDTPVRVAYPDFVVYDLYLNDFYGIKENRKSKKGVKDDWPQ